MEMNEALLYILHSFSSSLMNFSLDGAFLQKPISLQLMRASGCNSHRSSLAPFLMRSLEKLCPSAIRQEKKRVLKTDVKPLCVSWRLACKQIITKTLHHDSKVAIYLLQVPKLLLEQFILPSGVQTAPFG